MKDIKKVIAINIKYIRYQEGLSQEEFCEKYNLNIKYLSNLENANTNIKIDTLANIADDLNVTPVDLITYDKNKIINKKRIDEKE